MPGKHEIPKVLIADDSDILNNMMRDVFEEHGFEVVQAFDGVECKAVFVRAKPDLAFIDVYMPKLDGLEALKFIKEKSPRTIVVVMTGVGNEETAVKAMKLGAADYLTKPFELKELVDLAETLLEDRRSGEENVRLRNKIRRSESYLAHLTTIINEALITVDPQGRIQSINRAACNLWGYSRHELIDQDIHFLIRGEHGSMLHRDLVRDTIANQKIEGEFIFRKKNKGDFPGYLSTSVISESGKVTGIVIVVADLTRIYEIERRLKQSEKLASLGKMVEGIAHEVRNCLTSLGGFTKRLHKALSSDPVNSQYTKIILDDVSRLEDMVRDIEEYVRFSKFHQYQFEKVDLGAVIQRARESVQAITDQARLRSIQFVMRIEKSIPKVPADKAALEEVFYNLILNAIEAMPGGGKLTIQTKSQGATVSVSIMDTGVGIHDQDLGEIFNPFFTSKTVGAGMGLSKVFLLVEEHGGIVNVSSTLGKGTVFEIVLPVDKSVSALTRRF